MISLNQIKQICLAAVAVAAMLVLSPAKHALAAGGNVENGAEVYKKCKSCHRIGHGAKHGTGPHLNDIFGAPMGAQPGYNYSKAMKQAGLEGRVWDFVELDAHIKNPVEHLPGTKMRFRGIPDQQDRLDVIAFMMAYETLDDLGKGDPIVPPEILAIKGQLDYGEYLSSECLTCHQSSGEDEGIPSIVGWPVDNFVTVMHAYKSKARENEVMRLVAGQLDDEGIASLAAYFAQLNQ